jgi:hypothetical protein
MPDITIILIYADSTNAVPMVADVFARLGPRRPGRKNFNVVHGNDIARSNPRHCGAWWPIHRHSDLLALGSPVSIGTDVEPPLAATYSQRCGCAPAIPRDHDPLTGRQSERPK